MPRSRKTGCTQSSTPRIRRPRSPVTEHGGRLIEEHETHWYSLVVMADPDGSEFCVGRPPSSSPPVD
ncbi:MAG: VOC family protein [Acidimicrobiia bacterium]